MLPSAADPEALSSLTAAFFLMHHAPICRGAAVLARHGSSPYYEQTEIGEQRRDEN